MFGQIRNESDLTLFCDIAGIESVESLDDIPTYVLIPAFIISELRIAFYCGFIIYIVLIVLNVGDIINNVKNSAKPIST